MFGTLDPSLAQIVPQLGAGADGEIVAESGARFRLETVLGAGGFGVVVRARCRVTSAIAYDDRILNGALAVLRELTADGELWVPCALKFIQPSGSRWESFEEFHREAMAWLGCAEPHPHVLRAYGLEFTPTGIPFLQLELARGGSLAGRLANGRLSVRSVVFVLAQIADALMHAGQELSRDAASFSHGDIKPANVLLGEAPRPNPSDRCCCDSCIAEWVQGPLRLPDGGDIRDQLRGLPRPRHLIAKLTDFGMARLASSHDLATPEYMAPEQFDGDRSPAVDVYALGVTAFQLLTGELPFADVHPADEWRSRVWRDVHRHRPPRALREVSPPTPADVAELIDSCLAKRDSDRPALGELKARLEACASAMGFHGTPPTVAHRGPGNHAPGARMRLVRGIEGLVALGTASALGGVEAIGRRMPSEGWEEDGTYSVVKEWEAAAEHQLGVAAGAKRRANPTRQTGRVPVWARMDGHTTCRVFARPRGSFRGKPVAR
ncbi:MAG: serine/threonine-protein kinase [Polyangiaceae bacterium]